MDHNWKKNIILFLSGQTISLFGTALVQYAIMWHITLTTQSGVMMTISIVCGFLPTFFLSPFAGVWADRYNRKKLIILSDSFIALSTLILAILFMNGYDALWLLFVTSAIRALGTAVQTPAVGAILPLLVPEDKLTKVNGVNGSIQALVMLTAPMLSAALLTMASIEIIFLIDVVTAAIAVAILLLFVRVKTHAKAAEQQTTSYFADMRKGFDYVKEHSYVKKFFLFMTFFMLLVAPAAFLTPLQVTRTFGEDVWRLTAIEIAFSIGMMLGGALIASWGGFSNKIHTMTLSCLMFGLCTVALGVVPNFWIYIAFMGLAGVSMPLFNTPATVLLQEKVEVDYMGRVFGVMGMISSVTMPMGMLVFGPLADVVDIEWLLIVSGALLFIQAFFLLGNKSLVEAGKPVAKPETEREGEVGTTAKT
ncbi:MFS transporter [Paenibacillus mendelii]|uniref:MFS transporter n=1 Tax=Paenibacillus mendelii TaxID=206163 RepID=A0ABV6J9S3_9BACL|nr:MFS transporter [Paenibacillus mendelii]MCQ6563760.1 MFS transporter [Paenibacillus mendelii]